MISLSWWFPPTNNFICQSKHPMIFSNIMVPRKFSRNFPIHCTFFKHKKECWFNCVVGEYAIIVADTIQIYRCKPILLSSFSSSFDCHSRQIWTTASTFVWGYYRRSNFYPPCTMYQPKLDVIFVMNVWSRWPETIPEKVRLYPSSM